MTGNPRTTFGRYLEAHRKRRKLSQDELATKVGVKQSTISDFEIGLVRPPLAKMAEFADALDLSPDERAEFVEEAYLAHAPTRVRDLVVDLRRRVRLLERAAGLKDRDNSLNV